jgi:hypothetical protein
MTEQEWLASHSSPAMLGFLRETMSDRKTYLTAAAFLRRFWQALQDERSRQAVEAMERYADGLASWHALRRAQRTAVRAFQAFLLVEVSKGVLQGSFYGGPLAAAYYAAGMDVESAARCPIPEQRVARARPWLEMFALGAAPAHYATDPYDYSKEAPMLMGLRSIPPQSLFDVPTSVTDANAAAIAREQSAQAALLRDIFTNPFRPVSLSPACLTPAVLPLAQTAYEHRSQSSGELDPARLGVLADALEDAGCTAAILDHLRSPGPHVRGCFALDLVLGRSAATA